MSLKSIKQMKKSKYILGAYLTVFCLAPYSIAHAQISAPVNFQLKDDVSTPITCSGNTYYVSRDGKDTAAGLTPATAWATVSKVNKSSFSPGDCILFNRGNTWNEQLLVPSSGTAKGYITFGAYGSGAKPVFDGTGVNLARNHGLIRGSNKNYIIVDNIRVQNSGIGKVAENSGIGFYGGTNLIVQHCEVDKTDSAGIKMNVNSNVGVFYNDVTMTNCNSASEQISLSGVNGFEVAYNDSYTSCAGISGAGIDSKQGSKNGTIHHNEVWDIKGANGIYADAFNLDTSNIQIYNNYVHDIGAGGIVIGSESGGALHSVMIHHNIVKNARRGALVFHNQGTTGSPVYDIFIYNNTFYQNGTSGTASYGSVRIFDQLLTGVTFKNNIISHGYNFQIGVNNVSPAAVTLNRNVIYGANVDAGGFKRLEGTNTIIDNPLYVDAAGSNFQLQGGSPAINSCDNSVWQGVPNINDYNGVAITDGSGNIVAPGGKVNCGAYE